MGWAAINHDVFGSLIPDPIYTEAFVSVRNPGEEQETVGFTVDVYNRSPGISPSQWLTTVLPPGLTGASSSTNTNFQALQEAAAGQQGVLLYQEIAAGTTTLAEFAGVVAVQNILTYATFFFGNDSSPCVYVIELDLPLDDSLLATQAATASGHLSNRDYLDLYTQTLDTFQSTNKR
jgi:hypothetical protein